MNTLKPFCVASDGHSLLAISFAYNTVYSNLQNDPLPPNWLVLVRSSPEDASTSSKLTWSVQTSVHGNNYNIFPDVAYTFSCAVSKKAGVFVLHVRPMPVRKTTRATSTHPFTIQFPYLQPGLQFTYVSIDTLSPAYRGKRWSPFATASQALVALPDIQTSPALAPGVPGSGLATDWTQVFVSDSPSSYGASSDTSSVAIMFSSSVQQSIPEVPQTTWSMGNITAHGTFVKIAYGNNTLYTLGTSPSGSPVLTALAMTRTVDSKGQYTFVQPTEDGIRTISIPVADNRANSTAPVNDCQDQRTIMAAAEGSIFILCFNSPAFQGTLIHFDGLAVHQSTLRPSKEAAEYAWPNDITPSFAPLYFSSTLTPSANNTGLSTLNATAFLYNTGDATFYIDETGLVTLFTLSPTPGSTGPNAPIWDFSWDLKEGPPSVGRGDVVLSVSTIILIVLGCVIALAGTLWVGRWTWRRRQAAEQERKKIAKAEAASVDPKFAHPDSMPMELMMDFTDDNELAGLSDHPQPPMRGQNFNSTLDFNRPRSLSLHPAPNVVTSFASSGENVSGFPSIVLSQHATPSAPPAPSVPADDQTRPTVMDSSEIPNRNEPRTIHRRVPSAPQAIARNTE